MISFKFKHIKFICEVLQFGLLSMSFSYIYKHWSKEIQYVQTKKLLIFASLQELLYC